MGGLRFWSPAAPAFSFDSAPLPRRGRISPDPRSQSALPRRGRGRPRLFHARGEAPCIPSIKPLAAQAEPEKQAPGGGLPPALPVDTAAVMFAWAACVFGRLPPLPLAFFVAPIPPTPFPAGEGGDSKIILPGATAPGTPAFDRLRHLQTLPCRYPGTESLAAQAEPEKQAPGEGLPRCCRLPLSCRCPAAEAGRRWDGASPAPGRGLPPALPVDPAAVVFGG